MANLIKRFAIFILVLFCFQLGIKAIWGNPFWGNPILTAKLNECKDQIKNSTTLFIGSSIFWNGIDAQYYSKLNNNQPSFNLSTSGMFMPEVQFLTNYIIENPSAFPNLKFLVLEHHSYLIHDLDERNQNNNNSIRMRYLYNYQNSKWAISDVLNSARSNYDKIKSILDIVEKSFETFIGVSFLKTNFRNKFGILENKNHIISDFGYKGSWKYKVNKKEIERRNHAKLEKDFYANKKLINEYLDTNNIQMTKALSMIELINKKGDLEIVSVLMPRLKYEDFKFSYPSFLSLTNKKINFATPDKNEAFWHYKKNAIDRYHLSDKGAKLITEKLYKKLNK